MDAIEALKTRRAVRAYTSAPVPREIIEDIIDCGRLAATAINIQPWEFVVVTSPLVRRSIAHTTDYGKFIAEAPVCVVVLCQDTKYYLEDGSAATENIMLAARAHGLGSCWVAGDEALWGGDLPPVGGASRLQTGEPHPHGLPGGKQEKASGPSPTCCIGKSIEQEVARTCSLEPALNEVKGPLFSVGLAKSRRVKNQFPSSPMGGWRRLRFVESAISEGTCRPMRQRRGGP